MRECNFEKGMGMAGYMPQDVFEVGSASIAKMHLDLGHPVDELAADISKDCATAYIDDGIENDLKNAATEAIQMLETLEAPSPAEFLHHFQYFTIHYDEESKPRKKKIFRGSWFNKAAQNKNRRQDFIKRLFSYYTGSIAGSMPLAPDGWSLGGRKYVSPENFTASSSSILPPTRSPVVLTSQIISDTEKTLNEVRTLSEAMQRVIAVNVYKEVVRSIKEIKDTPGPSSQESGQVIRDLLNRAKAARHSAMSRGAENGADPDWAAAAIIESWLMGKTGELGRKASDEISGLITPWLCSALRDSDFDEIKKS